MTIRTQQSQITGVGRPVLEAPTPSIAGARPDLGGWVNMVDVQRANVIEPATDTLSAKRGDQSHFLLPISRVLMNGCAILVPICFLALRGTVAHIARLSALLTCAVARPSMSQIAFPAAIFPIAVPKTVGMHGRELAASSACDYNWFLFHACNVAHEPKYFDIACRRISDALKQPDMFIERPKPSKQEVLEL